jgi:hypothetical protein
MTKIHKWFLKRIFKKIVKVKPGAICKENIITIFKLLETVVEEELSDTYNILTIDRFLVNCFEIALLIKKNSSGDMIIDISKGDII